MDEFEVQQQLWVFLLALLQLLVDGWAEEVVGEADMWGSVHLSLGHLENQESQGRQ